MVHTTRYCFPLCSLPDWDYFTLLPAVVLCAAHRVNARELRIKFHMDHPRAKRLLKEVIAEMGKEVTGPSKKSTDVLPAGKERKRTEREQKDATKAKAKKRKRTKKAKTKPNKEAAQKEHPTTTTTSSSSKPAESMKKSASTEEKGGAVKQSQLMKGVGILLMDLTEESYRDAVEAVREMGGTTYRGVPAEGTIEGIPWNKDALSVITHVLYPSPTRAIRELVWRSCAPSLPAHRHRPRCLLLMAMLSFCSLGSVLSVLFSRFCSLSFMATKDREAGPSWSH